MDHDCNERNCSDTANYPPQNEKSTDVFDHEFEGWSVWLEPCPDHHHHLYKEVKELSEKCGGANRGCHSFVPHVTLLYNIPTEAIKIDKNQNEQQVGLQMLHQALRHFQSKDDGLPIAVCPTQFYYFEYPKTADNGRGFGCVIHMLLVEKTEKLANFQDAVKNCFPPDERHQTADFIPHLAFIYAPECYAEWLQDYSNRQQEQQKAEMMLGPFRPRYLSLWSTKGKISDWYRIAKIEL